MVHLFQHTAQWQVCVNTVVHFRIPQKESSSLTEFATISFSRRILFHEVRVNETKNTASPFLVLMPYIYIYMYILIKNFNLWLAVTFNLAKET
jgi:hypothetical protein